MTEEDKFFQDNDVKKVLLNRANQTDNAVCISGDSNGKYSSEYLRWNIKALWAKKCVHFNEEERAQWFKDNPEPIHNKYKDKTNEQ